MLRERGRRLFGRAEYHLYFQSVEATVHQFRLGVGYRF
jgi:hypothetical protein